MEHAMVIVSPLRRSVENSIHIQLKTIHVLGQSTSTAVHKQAYDNKAIDASLRRRLKTALLRGHHVDTLEGHYYGRLTVKVLSHDNWCTVGGDGGCRVGEVRAGTTSPMPAHKGFKLQ